MDNQGILKGEQKIFTVSSYLLPNSTDKVKTRAPNYTNDEKAALFEICKRFRSTLESKKTGAFYIQQKRQTWQQITEIYNSHESTTEPRDEDQLKHLYHNIRYRAKTTGVNLNNKRIHDIYDETVPICDENSTNKVLKSPNHMDKIDDVCSENGDTKEQYTAEDNRLEAPTITTPEHNFISIMVNEMKTDPNSYEECQFFDNEDKLIEDNPIVISAKRSKQTRYKEKKQSTPKFKREEELTSSVDDLKNIYFRKKILLASLQIKNETIALKQKKEQHELQMKILRYQLEKAKKDCDSEK